MKDSYWEVVKPEKAFWLGGGMPLRTASDLVIALTYMPDLVFGRYVNLEKNDFANWIEDALSQPELADKIRLNPDQETTRNLLAEHYSY